jgi:glycosyltransferase involved in cell wall biosynthesis
MFAKLISQLPYSITLHGFLKEYGSNQKQKWGSANFAIVITNQIYEEVNKTLQGYLPQKIEIAPMGVDTGIFKRETIYNPWSENDTCHIFSCGRLNYCKGHQDLIMAVSIITKQGIKVKLDIAGEDEQGGKGYRKELEKIINELELNDTVNLLGAVSEEQIKTHLEKAHIFVLASLNEPLGVATMEAMSMEVPVLVTGAGGVRELVDDGVNGILVEPENPLLLATTILSVLQDQELSINLGKFARQKILNGFSCSQSAKILVDNVVHYQF